MRNLWFRIFLLFFFCSIIFYFAFISSFRLLLELVSILGWFQYGCILSFVYYSDILLLSPSLHVYRKSNLNNQSIILQKGKWITWNFKWKSLSKQKENIKPQLQSIQTRGGTRTAATSKMEHFVIIVNGWKPVAIIPKSSILDVLAVIDPPLQTI